MVQPLWLYPSGLTTDYRLLATAPCFCYNPVMQARSNPQFSLVLLGASEHGKSRLVSQLIEAYRGQSSPRFVGGAECRFETPQRTYLLRHGERHDGVLRYLLFGPTQPDAALVVV